jgi:hypothetical protein
MDAKPENECIPELDVVAKKPGSGGGVDTKAEAIGSGAGPGTAGGVDTINQF